MKKKSVLTKNIVVPPHKLCNYQEYVEKKLRELEGKNYSSEIGFLYKVKEILKIENHIIVKNNFSGCIVYKSTFVVEHCNPQEGEEIECNITQIGRLIVGLNGPLKIVIIPKGVPEDLKSNDSINVVVLAKEINHGAEYIKVVSQFVSKN